MDFGIQREIGNYTNTSTSGIEYKLYAGNFEISKLQLQIPLCPMDIFIWRSQTQYILHRNK